MPEGTFTVRVDVRDPEIRVRLRLTVGPLGDTEADKLTGELNPPVGVNEIVDFPELPGATESDEGVAVRVKPVGTVTVSVTVVVLIRLPEVPVTVIG